MAWILSLATFEGERVNTIPRGTDQSQSLKLKTVFPVPSELLFMHSHLS